MKTYVVDTHALLWFAAGEVRRLSAKARHVMEGHGSTTEVVISVVSLWEVALLHDEGRVRLPSGFSHWCDAIEAERGMRIEPLVRADVEEARALATLVDPHDRLIAGTALRLGVPLVTVDARVRRTTMVRTVW